jgi:DNA replication and repair protein RecF
VKHGFYEHWRQLQRILKQRNSLLRNGSQDYSQYKHWDAELINHSLAIEQYRLDYLKLFEPAFNQILNELDPALAKQKVFYKNGWNNNKVDFDAIHTANVFNHDELSEQLQASFAKDCQYQRTHIGAHRADLQIRFNQNDVKDIYSRGQKTTIVAAMKLTQAQIVSRETLKRPVLLLDDLPSELDQHHLSDFLSHVQKAAYQCFITAVDKEQFRDISLENTHMFHVERGKIRPMIAQGEAQE